MARRSLTAILFTDIVDSTRRAAELGDQEWRKLQEAHHARVRRALRRFGGREANTSGDGFLAVFYRPATAIRCRTYELLLAAWSESDPGLAPRVAEFRQRLAGLGMAPRG